MSLSPDKQVDPDEDLISVEEQRAKGIGPDFDPNYFTWLEKFIEDEYGPIVEFVPLEPTPRNEK
jgi:hypothetical protein